MTSKTSVGLAVWGLNGPVPCGQTFEVTVGARCEDDIPLAGVRIAVHDVDGNEVASGVLGDSTWGQTSLFWCKITLAAPADPGGHEWICRYVDHAGERSDAEHRFGIVSVDASKHQVDIEVISAHTSLPLAAAHVTIGPYRAVCDDSGRATIPVAPGTYPISAWASSMIVAYQSVSVDSDMRVSLELQPMVDRDPQYVAQDADFNWV